MSCKELDVKDEKSLEFYVGTYTNGASDGIYKYQLDANGMLFKIGLVAKTNKQSFL